MKTKPNLGKGLTPQKRVVIWGRFSSSDQSEGDSRRRQETLNRALSIREGYQIVAEYFDEGTSAKDGATPMFREMLARLAADVGIVCENLDRISRGHPWRSKAFIADILEAGHFIHTSQPGNERLYTAENIAEIDTLVIGDLTQTLAYAENTKRTKRVKEAQSANLELARQGKAAAFGAWLPSFIKFNPETKQYMVIEEKRKVYERIFKEYASGQGTTTIAKGLVNDGIPTLRQGNSSWKEGTVKKILQSECGIGTLVINGERIPKAFPPAISEDLFFKVQAMLPKNENRSGKYNAEAVRNVFRGVTKCACCGGGMKVHSGYIFCRFSTLDRCRVKNSVKFQPMEIKLLEWLVPQATEALLGKGDSFSKVDTLTTKKNAVEVKIEQTLSLLDDDSMPVDKVRVRLQKLETERKQVEKDLGIAKAEVSTKAELPATMDTLNKLIDLSLEDNGIRQKLSSLLPTIINEVKVDLSNRHVPSFKIQLVNGEVLSWSYSIDEGGYTKGKDGKIRGQFTGKYVKDGEKEEDFGDWLKKSSFKTSEEFNAHIRKSWRKKG